MDKVIYVIVIVLLIDKGQSDFIAPFDSEQIASLCSSLIRGVNPLISKGPQQAPTPFVIRMSPNATVYDSKQTFKVTLEGTEAFKGFFLTTVAPLEESNTLPALVDAIGAKFSNPDAGSRVLDCESYNANNAWGHRDNEPKTSVSVTWQAPTSYGNPLMLRAVVFKTEDEFWIIESPILSRKSLNQLNRIRMARQISPSAFLYHDGKQLTAENKLNATVETPLNITCMITSTDNRDTAITWTIEGTMDGHTTWMVVDGPDVTDNADGTYDVTEMVQIVTSRQNSPAIAISCGGMNVASSAQFSLDIIAGPVDSVLYKSDAPNQGKRKKRSPRVRLPRQTSEEVMNSEVTHFTCEAWEANPAVQINWYLNDVLVNDNVVDVSTSIWDDGYPPSHYTYDTYSMLAMTIDFSGHQDSMLRCTASNDALPNGISKELLLDVIVLPKIIRVMVNELEITNDSLVILPNSEPVTFQCIVEGAKPKAMCYLIVNGVPTFLPQIGVTPNSGDPQLSDTNNTVVITPDSATPDGQVWKFVGYNGHGDIDSAALIMRVNVTDGTDSVTIIPPSKPQETTTVQPTTTTPYISPTTIIATTLEKAQPTTLLVSTKFGENIPGNGVTVLAKTGDKFKTEQAATPDTLSSTSTISSLWVIIIGAAAAGVFAIIILVVCIIVTAHCRKNTSKQSNTLSHEMTSTMKLDEAGEYEPPPGLTSEPAYHEVGNQRLPPTHRQPRATSMDHTYEPPPKRPTGPIDHDYEPPPGRQTVLQENSAYLELDGDQHQYQDMSRKPPGPRSDYDKPTSRRPPITDPNHDNHSLRPISESNYDVPNDTGGLINNINKKSLLKKTFTPS